MKRLVKEETTNVVDAATGEVKESVVMRTYVGASVGTPFVMVFPALVDAVCGAAVGVALWIACRSGYNTGAVYADANAVADGCGMSRVTAWRWLCALRDAGFIVRDGGMEIVNPLMCWRGDMRAREAVVKRLGLGGERNGHG